MVLGTLLPSGGGAAIVVAVGTNYESQDLRLFAIGSTRADKIFTASIAGC
jgi:hypothetical protein